MELFKQAFQGIHGNLVAAVDIDHGLWIALKDRNVLTEPQLNDCKSKVCHY